MNQETPRIYSEIVSRLAAVRRKENRVAALHGALFSGLVVVGALLTVLLLEETFRFGILARTIAFYMVLVVGAGVFAWCVARPLLRLANVFPDESDAETSRKVGQHIPRINDHLVNILQLVQERERAELYSVELIDASFDDVRKEIAPVDFASIVSSSESRRMAKFLGMAVGLAILLFVVFPTAFFGSATRLLLHGQSFETPAPFRFIVEPGSKEVMKGEIVPIVVRVAGEPQKRIILSTKPQDQIEHDNHVLDVTPEGRFSFELPPLKLSTTYFVQAADVRSDDFTLTVIDRPVVKMLRVHLVFPAYTKLAPRQLDDNVGDVTALKGTRVTVSIAASKTISEAKLVFSDGTETPLKSESGNITGGFVMMKERTYHIHLKDNEGVTNAEPIEYALRTLPDGYPAASILVPGTNVDVADQMKLNMLFKISDDYGFTGLRLAHKLIHSRYEQAADVFSYVPVQIPEGTKTEGVISYLWSFDNMRLVPEDVVSYYIEVFDNDNISGPKSGVSEVYTLRLPSLDEVFSDLDKGHEVSLETMKEAMQSAQEAKKDLDDLQQQMKKSQQKLDWQDQKKAESLMKKYEGIQKKMDEASKAIEDMMKEMEKNQVVSPETLEKYQELQRMMEEMNSPEFAEAMKRMQQALQQMSPEQLREAMQNFQFSEENFRKSIERTMNLLKRIQIEQKVDEVVKRAEALTKQQQELHDALEQTNPEDKQKLDDLARQQRDLKEQLEQLEKELADLQKKMEDFPTEMPLSEMEQARKDLEQSQLGQQMDQISQQMQQQQSQQAMKNQQQAAQKMQNLSQQLQQMQQAMRENQQQQIVNEMRKAMQDLLDLSKRQEDLKNNAQSMEQNSPGFRENAQEQMEVMRDLGRVAGKMSKLGEKTFGITPEMGKEIGDAMREMNEAMRSLEQRNGQNASQQQSDAMGSLNRAAQQMQGSMNAMMEGGMGGMGMGMAGLMQRLRQMSGMQQGINQGTQNMGGQQAAEMARLAGEQGMVRKSLEQLAREARDTGQLSKLLGDLNQVAQEMREVQTDLAQGNVNPETLLKQERILSRLLDSQRSARERDFEKRRKAESGVNVARTSPRGIDLNSQEGQNRLRQDMLKAIEEGYAKDYEDLIRRYFEALERTEKQN